MIYGGAKPPVGGQPRGATVFPALIDITLILVAIVTGLLRIAGFRSQAFQAFAHTFVGGLIGAYLVSRKPLWLGLVVAMSLLEVNCFLIFRTRSGLATHGGGFGPGDDCKGHR